jgi:hypothetical protein
MVFHGKLDRPTIDHRQYMERELDIAQILGMQHVGTANAPTGDRTIGGYLAAAEQFNELRRAVRAIDDSRSHALDTFAKLIKIGVIRQRKSVIRTASPAPRCRPRTRRCCSSTRAWCRSSRT